jgi:hypothetical protein
VLTARSDTRNIATLTARQKHHSLVVYKIHEERKHLYRYHNVENEVKAKGNTEMSIHG